MAIRNLVDLLLEAKPKAALFTTYTLSLSFFEAVLLPVLKRGGCMDIAILVDAREARESLVESSARQAGRQYWLAMVSAPNGGVFHPKLSYLQCESEDILVVGSGNLTVAGQSTQLENLDAVSSRSCPSVFEQFSDFADQLAAAVQRMCPTASELLKANAQQAARAVQAAGSLQAFPRAPSLLHSLTRAPLEQIAELWRRAGDSAKTLTVLSPFHAPDARPVIALADAIDAGEISLGIEPRDLTAPFDKRLLKSRRPLRYVVPKTEAGNRRLHAKVFEVLGAKGALEVSGSINATHQSLASTKNVEVSLARWLKSPCFEWKGAKPRQFAPVEFQAPPAETGEAFVEATVESDGRVIGSLSCPGTLPLKGVVRLFHGRNRLEGEDLQVSIDPVTGHFEFVPPSKLPLDGALRLDICCSDFVASCWLNVLEDLTASDEERHERQAIAPILRGDYTHDHVAALLQLLYRIAVGRQPDASQQQRPGRKSEPQRQQVANAPFSYQRWRLSGYIARGRGSPSIHHAEALQAFIRWVNAEAVSSGTAAEPHGAKPRVCEPRFREINEEAHTSEAASLQYHLGRLIAAIPEQLSGRPKWEHGPLLATVAAAHALRQSLSGAPPWDGTEAPRPILAWLDTFSRFDYIENGLDELLGVALGLAALCVALARRLQAPAHASELQQALRRFLRNLWSDETLYLRLQAALKHDAFWCVPRDLKDAAPDGLSEILDAESLDEFLVRLARMSKPGEEGPSSDDKAKVPGVYEALVAQRRKLPKYPRDPVLASEAQLRGCPHCYQAFDEETRQRLLRQHAAVCRNSLCQKVIFFIQSPVMADRLREALGHARGTDFHPPPNVRDIRRRPPRTGSDH